LIENLRVTHRKICAPDAVAVNKITGEDNRTVSCDDLIGKASRGETGGTQHGPSDGRRCFDRLASLECDICRRRNNTAETVGLIFIGVGQHPGIGRTDGNLQIFESTFQILIVGNSDKMSVRKENGIRCQIFFGEIPDNGLTIETWIDNCRHGLSHDVKHIGISHCFLNVVKFCEYKGSGTAILFRKQKFGNLGFDFCLFPLRLAGTVG